MVPRVLQSKATRTAAATVMATSAFSEIAAAQAASEAGSAMCSTGLGQLVTFVLGFIVVMLVLIAGLRGAMAWNNMGSARKDKKRQGREQLQGAGITLVGAFFPALFAVGLDQAGINTLSCVDFGNVLMTGISVVSTTVPF